MRPFAPEKLPADLAEPTLASFADMARWIAAAMVMVGHLRNPLLLGYGDLPEDGRPLWVKGLYFVTGYHAEAVLVFFVLSGFLVGGLSMARASRGTFDPQGYAIDRVSRLFIAFVPAVLLTLALDWAGSTWLAASGLYDGTHPMIAEKLKGQAFTDHLSLPILLGNLAMLQNYYVPPLGSNDPLWTLSTEFWFYFVFGAVLAGKVSRGNARWALPGVAALACVALGAQFILLFGLWLVGFLTACLRPARTSPLWLPLLALFGWLGLLRAFDPVLDANLAWKDAAHYVMAALFGWCLLAMRGRKLALLARLAPFNRMMADFSYSLYLIHFPVMIFTIALLGHVTGLAGFRQGFTPTEPLGMAAYLGLILYLFAMSWLFAQATERHTARLRGWLKARVTGQSRA